MGASRPPKATHARDSAASTVRSRAAADEWAANVMGNARDDDEDEDEGDAKGEKDETWREDKEEAEDMGGPAEAPS